MSSASALDAATLDQARALLDRCCGSRAWVEAMLARRPFGDDASLLAAADACWATIERAGILEALAHHPRIGANVDELRKKYASTASWAASEQSGAAGASEETLLALRDANAAYDARFGYVFVVCATGKSAAEMLAILRARLPNDPETELRVAAEQQHLITRIRLEKIA